MTSVLVVIGGHRGRRKHLKMSTATIGMPPSSTTQVPYNDHTDYSIDQSRRWLSRHWTQARALDGAMAAHCALLQYGVATKRSGVHRCITLTR
jgi:hypothetical protein